MEAIVVTQAPRLAMWDAGEHDMHDMSCVAASSRAKEGSEARPE